MWSDERAASLCILDLQTTNMEKHKSRNSATVPPAEKIQGIFLLFILAPKQTNTLQMKLVGQHIQMCQIKQKCANKCYLCAEC